MGKFLSIIIPYYKEKKHEVFPLLSSINNQVGVDFSQIEVIMVNDGANNKLPDSFKKQFFNLDIHTIQMEKNCGPGVARQYGIDAANGEYLMFCDADDCLHSVGVVGALIAETQDGTELITSSWIEEIKHDGKYNYIDHGADLTWMHGKLIKRSIIVENDIRFHDELRVHEDSYFLAICSDLSKSAKHVNFVTYVWRWGKDTITRRNGGEYSFASMPTFNAAIACAIRWLIEHDHIKNVPQRILQVLCYNYFMAHSDAWNDESKSEYLDALNKSVVDAYKELVPKISSLSVEEVREIYTQERNREPMRPVESETIDMWMSRIGLA